MTKIERLTDQLQRAFYGDAMERPVAARNA